MENIIETRWNTSYRNERGCRDGPRPWSPAFNFHARRQNLSMSQVASKTIGFAKLKMSLLPRWPGLVKGYQQDHRYILRDHSIDTAPANCLLIQDLRVADRQFQAIARYAPQGDLRKRLQEAEHVCVMPVLRLRQEPVRLVHALHGQRRYGQSLLVRIGRHNQPTLPCRCLFEAGCKQAARNNVGLGIDDIAEISSLLTQVPFVHTYHTLESKQANNRCAVWLWRRLGSGHSCRMQKLGREVSFIVAYLSCPASVSPSPTLDRSSLCNEKLKHALAWPSSRHV